jgi:hypothetical protein
MSGRARYDVAAGAGGILSCLDRWREVRSKSLPSKPQFQKR